MILLNYLCSNSNHIGRLLDLIFVFDSSDAEVSRIPPLSLPEECYHQTLLY